MRILMIGPIPPPIGGAQTKCQLLLSEISQRAEVTFINTSRPRQYRGLVADALSSVRTCVRVLTAIPHTEVVLAMFSFRPLFTILPLIRLAACAGQKKVIVQLFGGSFDRGFSSSSRIVKWIIRRSLFGSHLCLVETKRLVAFVRTQQTTNVRWFPNFSDRTGVPKPLARDHVCRRFVYLGRVRYDKGIGTILKAAMTIPEDIVLHVYGPLEAPYTKEVIENSSANRVKYCGVLPPNEVLQRLATYDALVLPTFFSGEGYPGVIIQSFACGIPVIAARWLDIPELVDESCGILVAPHSAQELASAIDLLHRDRSLYRSLSEGAAQRAHQFSSDLWAARLLGWADSL